MDIYGMSLNDGNFLNRQGLNGEAPISPHKIKRGNKLRRYEDSQNTPGTNDSSDKNELARNFSPLSTQKAFGMRV